MTGPARPQVSEQDILAGLRRLGLSPNATVMVHSSLSSFGHVVGGPRTVVTALRQACGTVVMLAGAGDLTRLVAPPGLIRPNNSYFNATSWAEFDQSVKQATPYRPDLPVDRWLGRIPHSLVHDFPSIRGPHPLLSFAAIGRHEREIIAAETLTDCLGPLRAVRDLGGYVLQLGVTHTTNTTMHVAEQLLGRSLFYRYARNADGLWVELPNVPGESHEFDRIEPHLAGRTRTVRIGSCTARLTRSADIIDTTMHLIQDDPKALLCDDADCRCGGAYQQRLAYLAAASSASSPASADQSRRRHS